MNKPIVIQGALQNEIEYLLKIFDVKNKINIGSYFFYECIYKNYPVIISKTKIGEISSAIATTLAIQKYDPLFILNQGTAGALVECLNKKDRNSFVFSLAHAPYEKQETPCLPGALPRFSLRGGGTASPETARRGYTS